MDTLVDSKTIRRDNLMGLIATLAGGNIAAFSRKYGADPSLLSQIRNGTRRVGDKLARGIERALDKPRGWMDHPQFKQSEASMEQLEIAQILPNLKPNDRDTILRMARLMNQADGTPGVAAPFVGVPRAPLLSDTRTSKRSSRQRKKPRKGRQS